MLFSAQEFQERVTNHSLLGKHCFDRLADLVLEFSYQKLSPKLMSLGSLLLLFSVVPLTTVYTRSGCILAAVAIFVFQLLDVVNKKQAYRLDVFTKSVFFIDHLCDALGSVLIVLIAGGSFGASRSQQWLGVYLFAVLPVYCHYLTLRCTGSIIFHRISVPYEGLVILELILIVMAILNKSLAELVLFDTFTSLEIVMGLSFIWIVICLATNINEILRPMLLMQVYSRQNRPFQLWYLLVIGVIGLIFLVPCLFCEVSLFQSEGFWYLLIAVGSYYASLISNLLNSHIRGSTFKQFGTQLIVLLTQTVLLGLANRFDWKTPQAKLFAAQVMTIIIAVIQSLFSTWKLVKLLCRPQAPRIK